MKLPKIITTMLSGRDNVSLDIGRVLWFAVALVFICLEIAECLGFLKKEFHALDYAEAGAAILAAGGFGVAVKGNTEPLPNQNKVTESNTDDRQEDH